MYDKQAELHVDCGSMSIISIKAWILTVIINVKKREVQKSV